MAYQRSRLIVSTLVLFLLASFGAHAQSPPEVLYVYDELGRLVGVVDPAGETATYAYDAVGNLLSIARASSAAVSIIEFTPNGGSVGSVVTIFGTGFGTTPSQNVVKFNGTTASVVSSTANKIVVTVPAGATTGTISVTAPGGSATSAATFTVGPSPAPTITSFNPTAGAPGEVITITGTNYAPGPANTKVSFNGTRGWPTAATATTITVPVPAGATSGRISVATAKGTALSAADFFVPPSPYLGADVGFSGRVAIGGSITATIPTANKVAMVVFDGVAGQSVDVVFSGNTIPGTVYVNIIKPDGTNLANPIGASAGLLEPKVLPVTGTYAIFIDPFGSGTGSITLTTYDVPPDPTINTTPGAPPVTVTTTVPGQNGRVVFPGVAGQRVAISMTNQTIPGIAYVSLDNPDGSHLYGPVGASATFIDTQTLPTTGNYTVFVDPYQVGTGSLTITVHDVPADFTGSIVPGGPPVTATISAIGQNAQLTFAGTAGQRVALSMSGSTIPGITYVSIKKPDGTNLYGPVGSSSGFIDTQTLPVTGTYTVLVDPYQTGTGDLTLTLYDVPADVTGTITPGGSPVVATISAVGQNARLTFTGAAGQRIALGMTNSTIPGLTYVQIFKPDGTSLYGPVGSSGGFIDTLTLPVAGTYTIVVDPYQAGTGSLTLTLYDVPPDATGTITPGGSPVVATISAIGQDARLTFNGSAGQRVALGMTNSTIPGLTYVSIVKPDGTNLAGPVGASSGFIDTVILPVSGVYTILVDPYQTGTGSLTLTLYDVPPDATGSITPGGAPVVATVTAVGQNVRLTFTGSVGQRVSLGIANSTITPGLTFVSIVKPDGTNLAGPVTTTSAFIDTKTLPTAGTYTVLVDPNDLGTGSVTLTLYNVPPDFTGSITPGGASVGVTTTTPGQNAALTMSGTAGQQVTVRITNNQIGLVTVKLLRPDGTTQVTSSSSASSFNLATQTLATTGTYTISIDPLNAIFGSLTVTVTAP